LIDVMGGGAQAAKALEEMLSTPPIFHVGVYGTEIHEMSEMAAVPFGQYAHSNQPVHHLLYIFAHAGRPDLTQFWVRKVMRDLYTPETFAGDEDTGSMSAWFVLSALGFYPLCPGRPEYTLGSPLFARSTLHLSSGVTFTIDAQGNSPDAVFVRGVSLAGEALTGNRINHSALMKGGALHFEMATKAATHEG
jgi:putative alpha-1,2-mannosidase